MRIGSGDQWVPLGMGLVELREAGLYQSWGAASAAIGEALRKGRIRAYFADHNEIGLPRVRHVPLSHWRDHDPSSQTAIFVTSVPGGKPISEIIVMEATDFWDWFSEITSIDIPGSRAEAKQASVLVTADQAAIYRTGLAGRPTSWDLVESEVRLRWGEDTRNLSTAEWARIMCGWLAEKHPTAPRTSVKTLRNKLGSFLSELRAAGRAAPGSEPEMK